MPEDNCLQQIVIWTGSPPRIRIADGPIEQRVEDERLKGLRGEGLGQRPFGILDAVNWPRRIV